MGPVEVPSEHGTAAYAFANAALRRGYPLGSLRFRSHGASRVRDFDVKCHSWH
jgi:hypothetical protein